MSIVLYGSPWLSMGAYGNLLHSMAVYSGWWQSTESLLEGGYSLNPH